MEVNTHVQETYPASIFCIIATEFCERFSFCGLRTILSLYLRNELLFAESAATVIYHVFIMMCYVIPVVGAVCADSFLGRYRTILYFSLVYLFGNLLMCLAAVPNVEVSPLPLTFLGLSLIAIGTGGIKPCVAAFGGDQFHLPSQRQLLERFFSVFYFTINLGGFVGMIFTPVLRKGITCFGEDTCYSVGFGFPAVLMLIAILLFTLGKPWYRLKIPKENVALDFLKCTIYASSRRCKSKEKQSHWLDYANEKYPTKLIDDMKILFSVLFLYIPLPIFWSLFDQQGSRWTFQASRMDGNVFGMQIVPDQMQVVNPAMVLILIPFFDKVMNPRRLLENPLHRMVVGGFVAGLAFFSAGALELVLERTYPELPDKNEAFFNFINTLPCEVSVYNPFNSLKNVESGGFYKFKDTNLMNTTQYKLAIEAPQKCDVDLKEYRKQMALKAIGGQVDTLVLGISQDNKLTTFVTDPVDFKKSLNGKPRLRIVYIKSSNSLENVTVSLKSSSLQDIFFVHDSLHLATSAYMEIPQGVYECVVASTQNKKLHEESIHLNLGGVYTLVIREYAGKIKFSKLYILSKPNHISILWLTPQYFLISVAEILFGIAGLEFSFTQAPKNLKTVTIAGWYLSVAVGNFIVILVTQAKLFKSQAYEFFLFAALIVGDMMIFTDMVCKYRFVALEADSSASVLAGESAPLLMEKKGGGG